MIRDAITGTTGKDGNFSEVKLGDIQQLNTILIVKELDL